MSYSGYGQQPYGQPPPHQGYGQSPYPPQGGYQPPYGQPPQGPPPSQGYGYQQYPPQQGGYYQQSGPPPPNSYPPSGSHSQPPYGQPPPPQGYGHQQCPPSHQGGYHQPPPSSPHGSYPPPHDYGAPPPPQHYGHPPPGGPPPGGNYSAPPVQSTPASLGYGAPQIIQWNAEPDAQALRAAMKGFGTDEKTLIRVLSDKDPLQIDAIRSAFNRLFGRNLIEDMRKETSGHFRTGLLQLGRGPLQADIHLLHEAMDGLGTKEVVLNDILLSRSNADLKAIKSAYAQTFRRNLEDVVKGDLSMKTERHFMLVLAANRAEETAPVNPQQVDDDVMKLYKATEGRMGTDEILVCSILSSRNNDQIRAIAYAYKQKFRKDLDDVIKSEFSGHMKDALLHQLRYAVDKYMHAARLLEEAMAGMGTKDNLLIARVVRFHWDKTMLANVKAAYQQKYRRSLASRIKGETSGDYERLLVACIGEL